MRLFLFILLGAMLDYVPAGDAFLKQLQPRDSILIADQLQYGFRLDGVEPGTALALQDFKAMDSDTISLVRTWQIDTLKRFRDGRVNIEGSVILAPFEEGKYSLPPIAVARCLSSGQRDTLLFKAAEFEAKTMPVDTATFQMHDIKSQMRYPVTFSEVWPWCAGAVALGLLVWLIVYLVRRFLLKKKAGEVLDEPAYIVALRELDKYRGDKFWAPEKQKSFYSGITDVLKFYIDERFGIDAPEMTTAELFSALKSSGDLTPELYADSKELFERADLVKFAKMTATDEQNAGALPLAVRFVTSTYQKELEEEQKKGDVL